MLNALLSPFSTAHWQRYINEKVDHYYEGLTRESLQSKLRSDLISSSHDSFITELRQASRKQNSVRNMFDHFSVIDNQTNRRAWTQKGFTAYLSSRLGMVTPPMTRILWRCFCYNVNYPFTDASMDPEEQHVDFDGWIQAVALLSTSGVQSVGRNLQSLTLYGSSHTFKLRKECNWRRFVSLAASSDAIETGVTVEDDDDDCDDDWRPPDMLDEIAKVAACQVPIDLPIKAPPLGDIRARVEKLVGESSGAQTRITDFVIPYEDMLALLVAIMQMGKEGIAYEPLHGNWQPLLLLNGDSSLVVPTAKAILHAGGIHEGAKVSFAKYFNFSEIFRSSDRFSSWSFDDELTMLWHALFSSQQGSAPASSSHQYPPSIILQSLEFLCPLGQQYYDKKRRRLSLLEYSTDSVSQFSSEEILKALTWPYGPKLVFIYGNITTLAASASSQGFGPAQSSTQHSGPDQPALFAIITSSPLWCTYQTGAIDDFFVGDVHLLLELLPRPRALWYTGKQTKYVDLVNTTNTGSISFGHVAALADSSSRSSGLTVNFEACLATLSSFPHPDSGPQNGYLEIPVGPSVGPAKTLDKPQPWETTISVRKVEVYTLPDGVMVGLSARRPSRL